MFGHQVCSNITPRTLCTRQFDGHVGPWLSGVGNVQWTASQSAQFKGAEQCE